MTEKKQDSKHPDPEHKKDLTERRAAVRKILVGGGIVGGAKALPENWQKPVLDAVNLPAHAQTTTEEPGGGGSGTTTSSPTPAPPPPPQTTAVPETSFPPMNTIDPTGS